MRTSIRFVKSWTDFVARKGKRRSFSWVRRCCRPESSLVILGPGRSKLLDTARQTTVPGDDQGEEEPAKKVKNPAGPYDPRGSWLIAITSRFAAYHMNSRPAMNPW